MGFIPAVMLIYFNYKVNTISHLVNLQELHLALPVDLQGHKVAAAAAEAERGEPGHPQPPGKVSKHYSTISFQAHDCCLIFSGHP